MLAAVVVALGLAPWSHPLQFGQIAGWQAGRSGNTRSAYVGPGPQARVPLESAAWTATGTRYRDNATADPPNLTLKHLAPGAVVVWAVIYTATAAQDRPIRLALKTARRLLCCEGEHVAGGEWELSGAGPRRAYSVVVRIYFGSRPSSAMQAQARRALGALRLPRSR